jgi:hypothetical protein
VPDSENQTKLEHVFLDMLVADEEPTIWEGSSIVQLKVALTLRTMERIRNLAEEGTIIDIIFTV